MWCCIGQRKKTSSNNINNNNTNYNNNNIYNCTDNNNNNENNNVNASPIVSSSSSSSSSCCISSSLSSSSLSSLNKGLFQLCIPDEVKLLIFSYLTVRELSALSSVSRDVRALAMDDVLWMCFFVKILPSHNNNNNNNNNNNSNVNNGTTSHTNINILLNNNVLLTGDNSENNGNSINSNIDPTLLMPPARVCHSAVVYKDRMYIYGGHIPDPLNYIRDVKADCYAYHFPTRTWEAITASPFGAALPTKTEHTAVVHQHTMYLFGGYSNGTTGYSDVDIYSFDLETRICARVIATGHAPTDRSAHTAVVWGDSMYILGGWDGNASNNDFHSFHFPTKTWAKVEYSGVPPPSVRSHATVVYKDSMLVFGGYGESVQHPTSLFIFHFLEGRWEEINLCPPLSSSFSSALSSSASLSSSSMLSSSGYVKQFNGPCGRSRFRMVYHQESLWVFGGWDRQSYFADLWRYRLDGKSWQKVSADFELQGVGQHSLVVHQGFMYLYGGYCPVSKAPHPHLYGFRLPSIRNPEA